MLRLCFGIYDTKCDGANDERPVTLIKASPGGLWFKVRQDANGWGSQFKTCWSLA